MRILLTGASGFVGGHLAPRLVEGGHEVLCAVRGSSGYEPPSGARRIEIDLARPLEAATLPEVDAVVHLAQASVRFPDDARELHRVNTASTLELLDHARRTGAQRFVYASSASVYGFGDRPFAEDDPLAGRDFYAATKIGAEALVRGYDDFLTTAVLRLVVPYGPGQQARMIPGLIGRVRAGTPVTLNAGGRPRMNPLYIDDVVRTVVGVLELDDPTVLNIAGDEPVTVKELAEQIGAVVGREPVFEEGEGDVPGDIVADTSRLHELLDLRPLVPLADGLRRTAETSVATVPAG
jgi:nucleoside-diphosphate-sugar epimerase